LTNPANLSLKCDPGSRFQLASGAGAEAEWLFSLAPGDTMQGCVLEGNFAGNSTAVSVAGLRIAEGASGITIDGVTISDFSGPGIYAYGAAGNLTVRNSWIYGTCNSGTGATLNCGGIYVLDEDGPSGTQFVFTGNIIDNRSTNSGGLKVQADCGSTLTDVQTSNNIIYVGNAGASDALGIEYFASPGEVCPSGQDGALTHGVINGNILEGAGSPYTFGISLGGGSTQPAATGVSDIVIDGNTVNNFAYDAVEVTGANSVVVSNNQINASGPIAITSNAAAQGIANISVRGNNISRSVASSSCSGDICATANMYPLTGITIAQNSIRGSAKDAIDLIASNSGVLSDAIVDGNVIVSPAAYAISATDYVANLSVSGNLADMTGSTMATNGAITIQGSNSNNASVCGNTVLSSPAYAIFINNNPPNDRICGNTVASSLNGIYCMSCGNAAITQNVLTGASKGSGLVLTSAVNTLVFGNAISGFATNLSLGTSTLAPLSVAGHYATAGSAPSLSACGSGASVSGTDSRGAFSEGALAAGCTVTFAAAYPAAPFCTVTSRNGAAFTYAVTSATIVVTNAGTVSGALDYSCGQ
jgi:hypothetical protein